MLVLQVARDLRCRHQESDELVNGKSGLGDLTREVILQRANLLDDVVSALLLE